MKYKLRKGKTSRSPFNGPIFDIQTRLNGFFTPTEWAIDIFFCFVLKLVVIIVPDITPNLIRIKLVKTAFDWRLKKNRFIKLLSLLVL